MPAGSRISASSEGPSTNFIARKATPSASPASNTGMMCGWSRLAAAMPSRAKRSRNVASDESCAETTFSATVRCSESWVARYTTACPPRPISASTR